MDIHELREEINRINSEIIALFAERLSVTKKIAKVKKENHMPIQDRDREEEIFQNIRDLAQKNGLDPDIIKNIFTMYINYTKELMKNE